MRLKEYHHTIWLPFSRKIDNLLEGVFFFQTAKRLFDAHFDMLALVGILAPPEDDLACYFHLFDRYRNGKYRNLTYKERLIRCWHLILWAYSNHSKKQPR